MLNPENTLVHILTPTLLQGDSQCSFHLDDDAAGALVGLVEAREVELVQDDCRAQRLRVRVLWRPAAGSGSKIRPGFELSIRVSGTFC